jgi:hypothetical protein
VRQHPCWQSQLCAAAVPTDPHPCPCCCCCAVRPTPTNLLLLLLCHQTHTHAPSAAGVPPGKLGRSAVPDPRHRLHLHQDSTTQMTNTVQCLLLLCACVPTGKCSGRSALPEYYPPLHPNSISHMAALDECCCCRCCRRVLPCLQASPAGLPFQTQLS